MRTKGLPQSSGEQGFADVAALARPGGNGEDGAADVLDVLVERVHRAESALDRDELLLRVALEGDEEEAGFELAEALVDAVGEGVAAPQDPLAVVELGGGEADVGVDRDRRQPAGLLAVQRQRFELVLPAERGAAVLGAADRLLLVFERG